MTNYAEGKCPQCGAVVVRKTPVDYAVCDGNGTHGICDVTLKPVDYPSIYLTRKITIRLTEDEAFMLEIITSKRRGELIKWAKAQNPPIWENQEAGSKFYEQISQCTLSGFIRQVLRELIQSEKPSLVLRESVFIDRAKKGEEAEDMVFKWLESMGGKIFRFRYRSPLSSKELSRELKALLEMLPEPPDGIVKFGPVTYFVDVKFKSTENWVINISDYKHYFELSQILPVKIYFLVGPTGKIYMHDVVSPQNFKIETMWNGNTVYIIPSELVIEVAEVSAP